MKKKSTSMHQQGVRMDETKEALIIKYAKKLSQNTGMRVSFSAAVRKLIDRGLEAEGLL